MPYSDMELDGDVIMARMNAIHPNRPSANASRGGVPDCLWSLLLDCWSKNPGDRQSACDIREIISSPAFVCEFCTWFVNMIRSRPPNATNVRKHSDQTTAGRMARLSYTRGPFYFRSLAPRTCSKGKQSLGLVQDHSSPHC